MYRQWWNVTEYIYSTTVLKYYFEALYSYISNYRHFIPPLPDNLKQVFETFYSIYIYSIISVTGYFSDYINSCILLAIRQK